MKLLLQRHGTIQQLIALAIICGMANAQDSALMKEGDSIDLGGRKATLTKLDMLPYVESEYSRLYKFDSYDNPKLKELCEHYKLDAVIATGKDEFDRQILLNEWTHKQFKKFGAPSSKASGALEVLKAIDEGHTFFCKHYGTVLVSSAASLGWIDRPIALRRHQGANKHGGSTEHTITEIWSNQYRKWVMLDPTSNMYVEKDGIPLNAYEIRQEWFYNDGKGLSFVVGTERKKYKKSDLPIVLGSFPKFGDLTVDPDEPDKYGFIGFVPNTNLMDAAFDYAKMFIIKDKLCDGTKWHERVYPKDAAIDPYFPINQAALTLTVESAKLKVSVKTMTPNFKEYQVRFDGGVWKSTADIFAWELHAGTNRLEIKAVNQFGIDGPVSTTIIQTN
jgi:hypothetical protein